MIKIIYRFISNLKLFDTIQLRGIIILYLYKNEKTSHFIFFNQKRDKCKHLFLQDKRNSNDNLLVTCQYLHLSYLTQYLRIIKILINLTNIYKRKTLFESISTPIKSRVTAIQLHNKNSLSAVCGSTEYHS